MFDGRRIRIGREIFLAALGLPLESIDGWVIDRLTALLDEHEIHAGQRLFTEGEPSDFLYFMHDGEIRYTREGGPSWTLQGRWVIGGYEAIGERPSAHTAVAVRDLRGMRVPARAWLEMLEDNFQLARSAVVNASRGLMRIEERLPSGAPASLHDPSPLPVPQPGALSLVERLALLLEVRLLRSAGVQALADLAAVSEQVTFDAGQSIFGPEDEREHLIRIVDGEVVAGRADPAVERHYGPGDLVCAAAILGHVSEGWSARAQTPVRGISFPVEALFDLMEEHFDLVRSTFSALGARRDLLLEHLAAASDNLVLT